MSVSDVARVYGGSLLRAATSGGYGEGFLGEFSSCVRSLLDLVRALPPAVSLIRSVSYRSRQDADSLCSLLLGCAARIGGSEAAQGLLRGFFALLVARKRLQFLPEVFLHFLKSVDERKGLLRVEVALSDERCLADEEFLGGLESFLKRRCGADLSIRYVVDKSLLGGFIARVGDLKLDASLRRGVAAFARAF